MSAYDVGKGGSVGWLVANPVRSIPQFVGRQLSSSFPVFN